MGASHQTRVRMAPSRPYVRSGVQPTGSAPLICARSSSACLDHPERPGLSRLRPRPRRYGIRRRPVARSACCRASPRRGRSNACRPTHLRGARGSRHSGPDRRNPSTTPTHSPACRRGRTHSAASSPRPAHHRRRQRPSTRSPTTVRSAVRSILPGTPTPTPPPLATDTRPHLRPSALRPRQCRQCRTPESAPPRLRVRCTRSPHPATTRSALGRRPADRLGAARRGRANRVPRSPDKGPHRTSAELWFEKTCASRLATRWSRQARRSARGRG